MKVADSVSGLIHEVIDFSKSSRVYRVEMDVLNLNSGTPRQSWQNLLAERS